MRANTFIMKITLTTNNKIYSVEDELGFDCDALEQVIEQFKGLLVSAGFHPTNVDEALNIEHNWFDDVQCNHSNKLVSDWHDQCLKGE